MKRRRNLRVALIVLGCLVLLGGVARYTLPILLLRSVNGKLANLGELTGRIKDIDLRVWDGSILFKDIIIEQKGGTTVPVFQMENLSLHIHWPDVFSKQGLVGEVVLYRPVINAISSKQKADKPKADASGKPAQSWNQLIRSVMPVPINTLRIEEGELHYLDFESRPQVDIKMGDMNGALDNLLNLTADTATTYATLGFDAKLFDSYPVGVHGAFNVLNPVPTYSFQADIQNLRLDSINGILRAYTTLIIEEGQADLHVQYDAADGRYKGYISSNVDRLLVVQKKPNMKDAARVVTRSAGDFIERIFKKPGEREDSAALDNFTNRVYFGGEVPTGDLLGLKSLGGAIGKTFLDRLLPSIEDSIRLRNVGSRKPYMARTDGQQKRDGRKEERKEDRKEQARKNEE